VVFVIEVDRRGVLFADGDRAHSRTPSNGIIHAASDEASRTFRGAPPDPTKIATRETNAHEFGNPRTLSLRDYDGAFDLLGDDGLTRTFSVVKRGGSVVSIAGMPEPETARRDLGRGRALAALFWAASLGTRRSAARHGVRYRYLFMHPSGSDLEQLAALIDAKKIEVVVDRVFPFAEAKEALAYLERGRAKGKVVVRMSSGSPSNRC
jgi:NADPH:quinone reductase-like Zn-dependent oxidoreductase